MEKHELEALTMTVRFRQAAPKSCYTVAPILLSTVVSADWQTVYFFHKEKAHAI